jgi:glyoxylase-like metal-dependent hydrolase (beta-lactamase superfamily II)
MIRIKKKFLPSFCLFLVALMMCVSGTFSYAENEVSSLDVEYEDYSRNFDRWQTIIAEKWSQFEKLDLDSEWFTGYRLPADVYAFFEMPYEQDACCFLILGKEKALLWDTGTGIDRLRPLVEKITDLPVTVLNSHDHFDHIGGNAEFDELWCYDIDTVITHLTGGPTEEELAELKFEMQLLSTVMDLSRITVPDHIPGKVPTGTVKDGQLINLGGRILEVLYTPGHASYSIMLLDAENKLLFTGDMYYPGPLLAINEDSSFPDYVASMRKVADRAADEKIEWICCSHNYVEKGTDHLSRTADFLEDIQAGKITEYEQVDHIHCYIMDDEISLFIVQ